MPLSALLHVQGRAVAAPSLVIRVDAHHAQMESKGQYVMADEEGLYLFMALALQLMRCAGCACCMGRWWGRRALSYPILSYPILSLSAYPTISYALQAARCAPTYPRRRHFGRARPLVRHAVVWAAQQAARMRGSSTWHMLVGCMVLP